MRAGWNRPGVTRRTVLKGAAAAALATVPLGRYAGRSGITTLAQTPPTRDIRGTRLNLLQWSHFVPRHDEWFDRFVAEWAKANGVEARVDHINPVDVPATIASEISAGAGHDLLE